MKSLKYILSSLALCSGVVIAGTQVLQSAKTVQKGDDEKVKIGESFYAGLQRVQQSEYPVMQLDGAADGIPYGLRCNSVVDKTVSISWNTPEAVDGYFDDFEDHDDFAINSPGKVGWSYIDGDNKLTYSWSACSFKNQGQKMAFIVMNPSQTTPSVEGNPKYQPASGKKMLATMCSIDAPNNDWIISPRLNFGEDFKFSFHAKSYRTDGITPERIRVGYSTTDKSQSSFKFVTKSPYIELPDTWDLYEYTIPKEARYVCINCVSDDAFMLLIDDIMIGTNEIRPNINEDPNMPHLAAPRKIKGKHLIGFNVYRDGTKVNSSTIKEVRYTDIADTYAVHCYTVTALYSDGTESAHSTPLEIDVVDPRLLPFEDDFDDWTLHADKWSTPENPQYTDTNWSIDYYTYGLVDPAATYSYSTLRDYDQSLISRELRTLDRNSTYVRFDLRLCNWGQYENEVSYLALEITCDDGKTWTTIDTYDNTKGEFNWTTKQYSLKDYLKNDYFKLRWRAYGVYALHIDYWYVDDVKVWNPAWGSLKMNVTSANGPVNGATVELNGKTGGTYNLTTDANGGVALGQIEADRYAVTIKKSGFNEYHDSLDIKEGQTASPTLKITAPTLQLSTTSIMPDLALEEKKTESFTISNTGDGPLTWRMNYLPAKQTGKAIDFEFHKSWQASGDVQTCIAFDGEYYYTSSWYYLGEFWKYDREGNLIEQFRIPDMYFKLYDLAYDGRYFYGSDYSNRLFQLDFENKRIAGIIEITNAPDLQITHVAYNPNNDRFYVGGWNTLCEVRRNGRASSMAVAFDENQGHAIYGSAYDNVTEGGPYLWLAAEESYNENMLDQIVIYQYNLNTKKFTGLRKGLTDLPGYKVGSAATGVNNICGLEGTVDKVSGKYTLIGVLQQSPCLFFEYNVATTDTWLDYSPKKSTLAPGESVNVTVNLDARDGKVGQSYSNKITINTIPELQAQTITLGYNAKTASTTPRPTDLTANNEVADKVVLAWKQPAIVPSSYNVYSNGKLIASGITSTTYTIAGVLRGSYTYEVSAVYNGAESVCSDAAEIFVKQGAPYYTPFNLTSSLTLNRIVNLTWESPMAHASQDATLAWGTGEHADQLGITAGGTFYVGAVWNADDMLNHRNKMITSASIRIVNPVTYLAACIFKDGKLVVRQKFDGSLSYGDWNTVTFNSPITIEAGSDYTIAFQVEHAAGLQPISIDASKSLDYKGNMISTDGEFWFPATQMAIDGNFSIKAAVIASASSESAPIGYNIYRNGTKVNETPVTGTSFTDEIITSGTYNYTVTSVYANGESLESNGSTINILNIRNRLAPNEVVTSVECNSDVSIYWGLPIAGKSTFPIDIKAPVTTTEPNYPTYINSFIGVGGEMAVASDCKYIYTSVHNEDGRVNKYDLNGNFIEHFYIKGLGGIRNITFDGEHFWVSTVTSYIYKVDMDAHTILEERPISEFARHLTYSPELDGGKGGFEVGDWQSSIYTNRIGSKIGTGPVLKGACGTAFYDGKLYAFEQGGDNAYTIGIYDYKTNERIGSIDLDKYTGLNSIVSASAGGMSIVRTPEGLTLLAVGIQNTLAYTQFLFLDLASVTGARGYNIYRNGTKLNTSLLTQRYYNETLTEPGDYDYQIETSFIDGTFSEKSPAQRVTIVPIGTAFAPIELKAEASSYGYDVVLSYADPALPTSTTLFESLESQTVGTAAAISGWNNLSGSWQIAERGYHGTKSLTAQQDTQADIIIPAADMGWLGFFAKNADDHNGAGNFQVFASENDNVDDFVFVDEINTSELWSEFGTALPAGTRFVMIRKPLSSPEGFIDAIRLNATAPESTVWGYDIFRNGAQINSAPIRSNSYIDHNLTPGIYSYQVRQKSVTAALSPLSESVRLNLDYSNGGQAPENLRILNYTGSTTELAWNAPALGDAVNLKWHSGNSHDAAGLPSGGAFFAGARWLASDLKNYDHLTLSQVEVYVNQVPDALFILVYQGNNLVRNQYVRDLTQYSFNTILLNEPLKIDSSKDLRVVVYVEHNEITIPIGYDEGPAVTGRGNLYSTDGVRWSTTDDDETGIAGNWNISIGLKPYATDAKVRVANTLVEDQKVPVRQFAETVSFDAPAPMNVKSLVKTSSAPSFISKAAGTQATSSLNTFDGYNVYANNVKVTESPIQTTTFTDTNDYRNFPFVQFKVAAVYSQLGEVFANTVTISTTDIETETVSPVRVGYKDGAFRIIGATPGDTVSIYDASGKLIIKTTAPTASLFAVPATLPAGTYLVTVGTYSCKGMVK